MQATDLYSPWARGFSPYGQFRDWMGDREREKIRQEEQRRYDAPPTDVGSGYKWYRGKLYRAPEEKGMWIQGKPFVYEGTKVYPQYHTKSGEMKILKVPPRSKGVNVTTNVDMTKKTKGALEEKIITGVDVLSNLQRIDKLFDEDFLTYQGKTKAWFHDKGSKLGLDVGPFLGKKEAWKMEVDQQMLRWRKFITGVAGGEKEMAKIEMTTLNTIQSPAAYKSKRKQLENLTKASMARAKWLLEKGFGDIEAMTPKAREKLLEDYPLEKFGYDPQIEKEVSDAVKASELIKKYGG